MSGESIAFIGLGNMGGPMCQNLLKAGYSVAAFDLSAAACEAAKAAGASIAMSAAEAAKSAAVAITMLPAGQHVLETWTAVLGTLPGDGLLIDCSTVDVESARKAHELAEARACMSLDAPVSGGVGGARQATLTFMAGGTAQAFGRAEPILMKMGRKVFHCGGAGAGQAAKICNNMLLAISMIGVSETLNLGAKLGLENQVMYDVITASSGRCWSLENYCPVPGPVPASPANNDYKPGFAASLMLKDVRLSQKAAQATGTATPLGSLAEKIFGDFAAAGGGDTDFSGVIKFLSDQESKR